MILDSIKEYNEISERMKCKYVKNCKKCNGKGILKSNLGYVECTCMKKSKIIAREICNGVPERLIDKKLVNINNKTVANQQTIIKEWNTANTSFSDPNKAHISVWKNLKNFI